MMVHNQDAVLNRLSIEQRKLLDQVKAAMELYFGSDVRRIAHAHDVTGYAFELLQFIDADPVETLCASYLHDIGIPEAERKYDQCSGKLQEQEGPAVAKRILYEITHDAVLIERVCELVGRHHTPGGVDRPEFRILWDADALVNLVEVVADKEAYAIEAILERALVTEPGLRLARQIFLSPAADD